MAVTWKRLAYYMELQYQAYVDTTTGSAPTLTAADFGKLHIYSHASTSPNYTLPAGASANVGGIIKFIKTGTGTMTITAAASNTIEDSSTAGTIYCADSGIASITLQMVSATKWVIVAATNTWTTT